MKTSRARFDPECAMEFRELAEAAIHLQKAIGLLDSVNDEIIMEESVNSFEIVRRLSMAWEELNSCRLYTKESASLEELLVPAMALVDRARQVLESLTHRRPGTMVYGQIGVLKSIREALSTGIRPGLTRLESCMASA
ncbi:MAG: hypothetical protein AAGU11_00055 [Syntrophobacteraceae bacterium]